jgi:hypothetical protein
MGLSVAVTPVLGGWLLERGGPILFRLRVARRRFDQFRLVVVRSILASQSPIKRLPLKDDPVST